MSFIQLSTHSGVLMKDISINVILPDTELDNKKIYDNDGYPVLYLLHGMTDDNNSWMRYTAIERYARFKNLAVVMPNGDLSFYSNMPKGGQYLDFITIELPSIIKRLFPCVSTKREKTFIAGLSMGGHGALKCAFTNPDKYSYVASFSGVLDAQHFANSNGAIKNVFEECFGDIDKMPNTENDIIYLINTLGQSSKEKPNVYLWCGTEDSLFSSHEKGLEAFSKYDFNLTHKETEGTHSWPYWDREVKYIIENWLPL